MAAAFAMSFPTYQPTKPLLAARAKTMRKAMTAPERRLWWALRHRLPDLKFRRQFVIDVYIADFCYLPARLIVEVDGNQHGTDEARAYDARRTATIAAHGYRVLRFSNHDVACELDSVLDTIAAHAGAQGDCSVTSARHSPPPCGEGSGVGVETYLVPSRLRRTRRRPNAVHPLASVTHGSTPTPDPSPQGGGEAQPEPPAHG